MSKKNKDCAAPFVEQFLSLSISNFYLTKSSWTMGKVLKDKAMVC